MPNVLDSIPSHENLITGIIGQIFKTSTRPSGGKNDGNRDLLIIALVLALFLVVATEPFKVILRKNIGKEAISLKGIIVASVLYIGWAGILGAILYGTNYEGDLDEKTAYFQYLYNEYILWSGIACYLTIAIYVLVRGIKEYNQAKTDRNEAWTSTLYRGDSIFISDFSQKNEVQQGLVWRATEPKACFKVGLILTIVHPLIGLPVVLSSISFWVNEWFHVSYKWQKRQEQHLAMKMEAERATEEYNYNTLTKRRNGGVL